MQGNKCILYRNQHSIFAFTFITWKFTKADYVSYVWYSICSAGIESRLQSNLKGLTQTDFTFHVKRGDVWSSAQQQLTCHFSAHKDKDTMLPHFDNFRVHFCWVIIVSLRGCVISLFKMCLQPEFLVFCHYKNLKNS